MQPGSAVATFVPLWIFAPLLLIGVIELFRTPTPTRTPRGLMRPTVGYAPGAA
jgi:hypothetical protein